EARVVLTSLEPWIGAAPIEVACENQGGPGRVDKLTIECRRCDQFGFSPFKPGPSLMSGQVLGYSVQRPVQASVRSKHCLRLIPRQLFSLDSSVDELMRLQAFLSVLCGHQVFYRSVVFLRPSSNDADRERGAVRYLPRFAQPSEEERKRRRPIFLALPSIRAE